jgi:dynein heavy chain 2
MLRDELEKASATWGVFNEFQKEMGEMGKEEWITYKKKEYFAFQDFFLKWSDNLKKKEKDLVTRFLLQQIDLYQRAWPMIKLCTGEAFEKEHWRRLLSILNVPKDVNFDNLKFQNLVDSIPNMLKKSKEIKELSDRAQGEVTIREAINELRIWCESAEFEITDYDSNGRTTPLIKEWKEVITKVSDNQSLILSLKESRYFQGF